MYKLGSEKDIRIGQLNLWGYAIKRLWLVKDLGVRKYTKDCYKILGLTWDGEKCHGWCTVASGSLSGMRKIMCQYD